MALAAYGLDRNITVLTSTQLDITTKVMSILSPIEEITKNINRRKYNFTDHTSGWELINVLEKQDEDHGVCTMKCKMLDSLNQRFADRFFSTGYTT